MNGYQRINNTLHNIPTDGVPIMLHNFMPAAREAGLTMQQFRSNPHNIAKAFVDASMKYGLDGILTDVDTALEASALGAETHFPDDIPAKVVAPISDDIEVVIENVDAKKLQTDERVQIYLEAIRLIRKQVGGELFIRGNADQGAFSLATAVYGMVNMMLAMKSPQQEPMILRLIERCYEVNLAFHRLVKAAGADMTSFGDSMCSPDLISPTMYQKFAAPFQKRLAAELATDGIETVCHICGNTTRILQTMSECGFAGVEIDYKTDIAEVQKTMNKKTTVFGILDPSGTFCFGDEQTVKEKAMQVLETFHGKGIIIGAGCALPAETPTENIKTFVRTVREYTLKGD
jgi:uroporphyrinogen decarboxylase